jgi:DNA-binding response OmpR family regulator
MKILVVDDNTGMRELILFYLQDAGYKATQAQNGQEARNLLMAASFDLVITDIFMPDCDGIELIQFVKKTANETVIIAISGGSLLEFECLGFANDFGADYIRSKPLDMQDLIKIVETVNDRLETPKLR